MADDWLGHSPKGSNRLSTGDAQPDDLLPLVKVIGQQCTAAGFRSLCLRSRSGMAWMMPDRSRICGPSVRALGRVGLGCIAESYSNAHRFHS